MNFPEITASIDLLYILPSFYVIYFIYNVRCYKQKVINLWIRDDLLVKNLVPAGDIFYEFQYKSSIKAILLLASLVFLGYITKSMMLGFLVPMLLFHILIGVTKNIAIKKGYLIKN